jgi:4-hydroxy-tetrahydrodipicolinate synthase
VADPLFAGVGVALVTLFDDHDEVDAKRTAELAAQLVDLGVRGVVVAGSTGEAAALTFEERVQLISAVREAVPDDVPVLAGTGAPSARQAVSYTHAAAANGADGLLVLAPPRVADPRPYYETVVTAAGSVPVLAYHFPNASMPGIAVKQLADLPVAGLKDSSGDVERLLEEIVTWDKPIYTGSSALLSFAGPIGCRGAILSLANAEPEGCVQAFTGDPEAQRAIAHAHLASRAPFPAAIKGLVAQRFGTSTACRLG